MEEHTYVPLYTARLLQILQEFENVTYTPCHFKEKQPEHFLRSSFSILCPAKFVIHYMCKYLYRACHNLSVSSSFFFFITLI